MPYIAHPMARLWRRLHRKVRGVTTDTALKQPSHPDNDPELWQRSQRELRGIIKHFGKPDDIIASRTRRVLIYRNDFVIKLPTSAEGVAATFAEVSAQVRVKDFGDGVHVAPSILLHEEAAYPVSKMLYVNPLPLTDAIQHKAGIHVDHCQLGISPADNKLYVYDP